MNGADTSERTRKIYDDLKGGSPIYDVAARYGVSTSYLRANFAGVIHEKKRLSQRFWTEWEETRLRLLGSGADLRKIRIVKEA